VSAGAEGVRLCAALFAHLPVPARLLAQPSPELELALRDLVASGRAAWPTVVQSDEDFVAYVAARLPPHQAPSQALLTIHGADLYLACGLARGLTTALREFELKVLPQVDPAAARLGEEAFVSELKQVVREKLFVAAGAAPPKIVEYQGRGALVSWVRAAAIRLGLNLLRDAARYEPRELEADDLPSPGAGPEVELMKARHGADVATAFRSVFASLSVQERNVLRLHFLDGLNIDQIGAMLRVHRATAARWISRARDALVERLRHQLAETLKVSSAECQSLIALVESRLDLSLHRWLRDKP